MINDESNKCHYFAVKNLLELNSSGWLRGKKEAIINNDNPLKNALDDAFNYQNIENDPQIIAKLKPYINKYNWEGIKFPARSEEWKTFERNNKTIALNIWFIRHNAKTVRVAYRSEHNSKRKKQVILLMITDGKQWYYLAITNLSALLQGNSSNHEGDFYCLNCFSSYTTKNKLKEHEEICNNHDSCHIEMPKWVEKNIKIQSWGKVIKSTICNLSYLECSLTKGTILSKQSRKILHREKS